MPDQSHGREEQDRFAILEDAFQGRTRDLQAALDERSALLHELDHRVKNNLQLISSLMLMQSRRTADPAVRAALGAMHGRLNAVGVVHRRLFQANDMARFDLADFARDLVAELSGPAGRPDVVVRCSLQPAPVPTAQAASLALLFNELLSDAFRNAFPPGTPGELRLTIATFDADLRIEIAEEGVGRHRGEPTEDQAFGLTIVDLLARQLQAQIEREATPGGRRVTVCLPRRTSEVQCTPTR